MLPSRTVYHILLRGMYTHSRETTVKFDFALVLKRVHSKRKEFAPHGSKYPHGGKFFPFKVDPFPEND